MHRVYKIGCDVVVIMHLLYKCLQKPFTRQGSMGNSLWIGSGAQVHKGKIRQLDTVRIVEEFNEHPQRDSGLFLSFSRSALVPRPAAAGKREMISKARRNPRGSTSSLPDKASGKREKEGERESERETHTRKRCVQASMSPLSAEWVCVSWEKTSYAAAKKK